MTESLISLKSLWRFNIFSHSSLSLLSLPYFFRFTKAGVLIKRPLAVKEISGYSYLPGSSAAFLLS